MLQTKSQSKNWQRMKFEDFADTSPSVKLERGKEYSFIPMEFVDGQSKFPVGTKRKEFTGGGSKFANGDTIFARITPCLENGKIAMVKSLKEGVGFGSTEFFVFRGKDGVSDSDFVYYLSRTDMIRDPAIKSMVGASGRQRADKSVVDSVQIMVPALSQQKEVADILSTYDDLIENNTKRIKILEEIAQAIYKEWFVYFRFPGHEKVKMIDSKTEFGKIPEGWAVKRLDEDLEVVLGGTPSRANSEYWNGDVPWINSSETNHLRVITPSEFITKKGLDDSAAKLMPKRTTVLAITGATLGQVSLLEIECSANQSVVGIYDKNAIYNEYLYLFISDKIDNIISKSGGSAQQHINKKIVEEYQILVPPKKEIDEFNKVIKPIFNLLSGLLFSNQNLRQARDLLLPKLVTGEIKV